MGNPVVGERMRTRRKELGMTLDDISMEIGVARSTVQRYETGAIEKLKLPVIEAIARVLRVTPEWLVGKTDEPLRDATTSTPSTPTTPITDRDIRAAFFNGHSDDLSEDEQDALWADAQAYMEFKLSQRKKKGE